MLRGCSSGVGSCWRVAHTQREACWHQHAAQPTRLDTPAPRARRARLEARASELALEGDSLGRSLKAAVAGRERALVEHDVLKLQARARRGAAQACHHCSACAQG